LFSDCGKDNAKLNQTELKRQHHHVALMFWQRQRRLAR